MNQNSQNHPKRVKYDTENDDKINEEKTICPYLASVDRSKLDFDFEKLCSVSLTQANVYACLVCGKYFQGRGPQSHAYYHSLDEDHHVFINLSSIRIYCLPENYEILDSSLADIQYVVNPTYTAEQLLGKMSKGLEKSFDLNGVEYIPGYIGLNNIKSNSYMNVIIQMLSHITPLRDYLLCSDLIGTSELVRRFALLVRKIWNERAFKGHVSPHEFLQEVSNVSRKRFKITEEGDALDFFTWLLNSIHTDLSNKSKIVHETFQGKLELVTEILEDKSSNETDLDKSHIINRKVIPFLMLSLDLPKMPLFTNEFERDIIPQVTLESLLEKYNGEKAQFIRNEKRVYRILTLPSYLILTCKRFFKNDFISEKNTTIVNFPLKNIEVPRFESRTGDKIIERYQVIANISHVGGSDENTKQDQNAFKIYLLDHTDSQWFQLQDLIVEKIRAEMLLLSECYILVMLTQS